jgi:hypothetical protein
MRRFTLISLAFLATLLISGCSAFKTEFRDEQGRALDHPYGDEKVITTIGFYQNYNGWVSIAVNGGPSYTVPYGASVPVSFTSEKYFTYVVTWKEMIGNNEQLCQQPYRGVGLIGKPIVIDEFLLRNWAKLEVVVKNISSQTKTFQNIQGQVFTLRPYEEKTIFVVAGDFVLVWEDRGQIIRGCRNLAPGHKVPWQDRSVDAVFLISDFAPNYDQGMLLEKGGCIRL